LTNLGNVIILFTTDLKVLKWARSVGQVTQNQLARLKSRCGSRANALLWLSR